MSRLSFRPRPLDIHKKLPIVKNFKDFEDDDTPSSTRNHMLRLTAEPDIEVACVCFEMFFVLNYVNYVWFLLVGSVMWGFVSNVVSYSCKCVKFA